MRRSIVPFIVATALLALVPLTGCAPSSLQPHTFPAAYQFMGSPGDYSAAPDCAAYAELVTEDGRSDMERVGVRYLEEGGTRHDVGMSGDVEAWLRSAAEEALRQAAIEQSGGSGHTVTVSLESITTDEAVYRRAEYDGKVVIQVSVSGGGASWSATKDGFAENYGYAGSDVNYQETVNHALDKALAATVSDSGFVDALCE